MKRTLVAFARSRPALLIGLALIAAMAAAASALVTAERASPPLLSASVAVAPGVSTSGDGVPDIEKIAVWGADPASNDTDHDGLPDAWEIKHARLDAATGARCPDPVVPDANASCIAKGMTLAQDFANGTDPWRTDTDGDGIPDAYETTHGMDPLRADADADPFHDGLTNFARYQHGARADRQDTACSGMSDADKIGLGLDPSVASTGGSGVPDGYAIHFGLDPRDPTIGAQHLDGDPSGLTVLEKARYSFSRLSLCAPSDAWSRALDPRAADTDGDGMPDAWELRYGLDPTDPADALRASATPGRTNRDAFQLGLCPDKADCDGDGLTNLEELAGWNVTVDGITRHVASDPMRASTDGSGLGDQQKRDHVPPLDPTTADTDADGIPDTVEIARFSGILDPTKRDSDGDGMTDGEKVAYWDARALADPSRAAQLCALCRFAPGAPVNIANPDVDGDGLTNGEEVHPSPREGHAVHPTDPANADTDGDGLPDAWERAHAVWSDAIGGWDLDAARSDSFEGLPGDGKGCPDEKPCSDGERDIDADGLPAALELRSGGDPHVADTNHDGIPDGWAWTHGNQRFAPTSVAGRGWTWLPRAGDAVPLSVAAPDDPGFVLARYQNASVKRTWTLLDAYKLGASPERPDTSGDGIPDFVKTLYGSPFAIGANDGARDDDHDGLTNAQEFALGTDPLRADTDGGGLPDGLEVSLHLDPLTPLDDAADGDADGDGLSNADEIHVYHTDPNSFDSIGKGLLDGPSLDFEPDDASPLHARLLAAGIAHRVVDGKERFFGNFEITRDASQDCAHKMSCSGDGIPDAWKLQHGIDPTSYHAPGETLTADGITTLAKYRWGRPPSWDEATQGPWWLGLDPGRSYAVNETRDLDHDGLDDLNGEDPNPHGTLDLTDRGSALAALLARDALPPAPARAASSLVIASSPAALAKGQPFEVRGRLAPATARVPVLAFVGDAGPFGVAFTDSDGAFTIRANLTREQSIGVPAGVASLFGHAPAPNESWIAATASLHPGDAARLRIVSYGVARAGDVLAGSAWSSAPLPLSSDVVLDAPALVRAPVGEHVEIVARVLDGARDAWPERAAGATLATPWGNLTPETVSENLTFALLLPPDATAQRVEATLAAGVSRAIAIQPVVHARLDLAPVASTALVGDALVVRGSVDAPRATVAVSLGSQRATATADGSGAFAATLPLSSDAGLGTRNVEATFAGDEGHAPARARSGPLTVRAAPAFVNVTGSLRVDAGGHVKGRLLAAGAPVVDPFATGPLVVRAGALSADVAADGSFDLVVPANMTSRIAPLDVILASDATGLVDAARAELSLPVRGKSTLSALNATVPRGASASISGRITDERGIPIGGATIAYASELGNGSVTSDALGGWTLRLSAPSARDPGDVLVTLSFSGDDLRDASSTSATATVVVPLHVEIAKARVSDRDPTVRGRVLDDRGAPVAISGMRLDGEPVVVAEDGGFAAAARPESHLLRFTAPAADGRAALDEEDVLLVSHASILRLVANRSEALRGDSLLLRARLTTLAGQPIARAAIAMPYGGSSLTDADGQATLETRVPVEAPLGATTLFASYPATDEREPATANAPLTVRESTTLRLVATHGEAGTIAEIQLRSASGAPVAAAPVMLSLGGNATVRVDTDAQGAARVRLADVATRVEASYGGSIALTSARVESAVAARQEAALAPAPAVWPWLLAATLSALAIVLVWRFRARTRGEVALALAPPRLFEAADEHGAAALRAYGALVDALAKRGFLDAATASPRDVLRSLVDLGYDASDVELVVTAFESARYGGEAVAESDARQASAALARLRSGA